MKLTIIGTGYVGLVTGACLADVGNQVLCLDLDPRKIDILKSGGIPIYEPGLKEIVASNVAAGGLAFSPPNGQSVARGGIPGVSGRAPPPEGGSAPFHYIGPARRQNR